MKINTKYMYFHSKGNKIIEKLTNIIIYIYVIIYKKCIYFHPKCINFIEKLIRIINVYENTYKLYVFSFKML